MPLFIHVGVPRGQALTLLKRVCRILDDNLKSVEKAMRLPEAPAPAFSAGIPSTWGLESLCRLAASVALGKGLPDPMNEETVPDLRLLGQYDDQWDARHPLRYSHLVLGTAEGLLIPSSFRQVLRGPKIAGVGSSQQLRAECLDIAQHLGVVLEPKALGTVVSEGCSSQMLDVAEPYRLEAFSCAVVVAAASASTRIGLPIFMTWRYPRTLPDVPITYEGATFLGFGRFEGVATKGDGRAVEVEFANGYRYRIPLAYFLTWYSLPPPRLRESESRIRAIRRLRSLEDTLRLYLVDGRTLDVMGANVLELCEPRYDRFGGDTLEPRKLAKKWVSLKGPFRVWPPPEP